MAEPADVPPGRRMEPGQLGEVAGHSQGDLGEKLGLEIVEASSTRVVGRMPVRGNTQPYGLLHGGASCVLAESLGSVGAALHAGEGRYAVGVDINATHHRGATDGWVVGEATPLFNGRTTTTWEVVITHEETGKRICTARLTCALKDVQA